jgi:hypothetical protein
MSGGIFMFLVGSVSFIVLDIVFLVYAFVRIFLSYSILTTALEKKDSRGYRFLFLSLFIPEIAYFMYRHVLKKEDLA